jgi:hypothetical protein
MRNIACQVPLCIQISREISHVVACERIVFQLGDVLVQIGLDGTQGEARIHRFELARICSGNLAPRNKLRKKLTRLVSVARR